MRPIWTKRIAATLVLLSFSTMVLAQYIWLDERGMKQFSDMPPPASVPAKNILKQPGRSYTPSQSSDSGDASDKKATAEKDNTPMTTAEKNAEFQKRRAKQAEDEAKAAVEAKNAAAKAKKCGNARAYQRSLSSGERIATTDKNGERSFLSDEQRARELKDAQSALSDCK